jgi:hypothetical protein
MSRQQPPALQSADRHADAGRTHQSTEIDIGVGSHAIAPIESYNGGEECLVGIYEFDDMLAGNRGIVGSHNRGIRRRSATFMHSGL